MEHDPISVLLDMLEAVDRAERLTLGMNEDEFLTDERTQWAVFSQIVILGEAAGRVPRSFQDAHPEIPWASAIGMRHRLVHGYDTVDWVRVWRTVVEDLSGLRAALLHMIPPPPPSGGEHL